MVIIAGHYKESAYPHYKAWAERPDIAELFKPRQGPIDWPNRFKDDPKMSIPVESRIHKEGEFNPRTRVELSPRMTTHDVRCAIRDATGIMPGVMKLSYAGKMMDNSNATLLQYGVPFWHEQFPDWPITLNEGR
eukprot:jgi/Mesvir1/23532/Mv18233-RA.1